MKSFLNSSMKHSIFSSESSGPPSFGSCPNCMSFANVVAEMQFKLLNERALSTGKPCTCKYVILHQSFHRGTLSIHWYIAQNFQPTFSMSILRRCSSKTAMLCRFLKVAMAMSSFMKEVYKGRFLPEFCISMVIEIIMLVGKYVNETRK